MSDVVALSYNSRSRLILHQGSGRPVAKMFVNATMAEGFCLAAAPELLEAYDVSNALLDKLRFAATQFHLAAQNHEERRLFERLVMPALEEAAFHTIAAKSYRSAIAKATGGAS